MMNPATEVARRALAALAKDEPYAQRLSEARSCLKLLSFPNRVALDPKIVEIVDKAFDEGITAEDHEAALVSAIETVLRLG